MMLLYQIYDRCVGITPKDMRETVKGDWLYHLCRVPARILYLVWSEKYG